MQSKSSTTRAKKFQEQCPPHTSVSHDLKHHSSRSLRREGIPSPEIISEFYSKKGWKTSHHREGKPERNFNWPPSQLHALTHRSLDAPLNTRLVISMATGAVLYLKIFQSRRFARNQVISCRDSSTSVQTRGPPLRIHIAISKRSTSVYHPAIRSLWSRAFQPSVFWCANAFERFFRRARLHVFVETFEGWRAECNLMRTDVWMFEGGFMWTVCRGSFRVGELLYDHYFSVVKFCDNNIGSSILVQFLCYSFKICCYNNNFITSEFAMLLFHCAFNNITSSFIYFIHDRLKCIQ